MCMPTTIDQAIWEKVQHAFAEALGLDLDEVRFDDKIIADLEAESLDFLDIAFRLERAFDIKIPRGGIESAAQEGAEDGVDEAGVLTEIGLARLKEAMPEVPAGEFVFGMRADQIPELFRVATFYGLVVRLLEDKQADR